MPAVPFFKKRDRRRTTSRPTLGARDQDLDGSSDSEGAFSDGGEDSQTVARKRQRGREGAAYSSVRTPAREDTNTEATDFEKSRPAPVNEATKASDWFDDEIKNTAASSSEKHQLSTDPNMYTGQAGYQKYVEEREVLNKKALPGPKKAMNSNIRSVTVIDYQPDVCKDYKETGFCGFGDSCKFLHDRENYKAGWELDRDWEEVQKKNKRLPQLSHEDSDSDSDSEDDLPFSCYICRSEYKAPVVTRCGHYFCEKCALTRYKKNPTCAVCGTGTSGIFNTAKKITQRLAEKRERIERKHSLREGGSDGEGGD